MEQWRLAASESAVQLEHLERIPEKQSVSGKRPIHHLGYPESAAHKHPDITIIASDNGKFLVPAIGAGSAGPWSRGRQVRRGFHWRSVRWWWWPIQAVGQDAIGETR